MKTKIIALAALSLVMAYAGSGLAEEAKELKWADVPAKVQKTISEHMQGGKIEEIKKETGITGGMDE